MQVSSEASEEAAAESGSGVTAGGDAGEEQAGSSGVGGATGGVANEKDTEEGSSYKHRLSNVNFINMGNLQKIKCVVDNQVRCTCFNQL